MSLQSPVFHHVYLWLREDGATDDARAVAEAAHRLLTDIPGVQLVVVAAPAGAPLPMVDSSYSLVLLLEFADAATVESYESHPDHMRFVEECKHLFSRVQVYNSSPLAG